MNKGTISQLFSASLSGLGLALPHGSTQRLLLTMGLFSFAGGITTALAIKMLFDKIPGLKGSGATLARFREFRSELKGLVLERCLGEGDLRQLFAKSSREFR